jgi:type IV pilus assembly protein PilA
MLQRLREKREEGEKGFTLIELLVVILIIAILAAIAIPVFLSQREKGWKSQLESALKNAATAAESYAADSSADGGDGDYVDITVADLTANGLKTAPDVENLAITVSADGNDFCISAGHERLTDPASMAVSSADSRPTETTCGAGVKA